MEKYELIEALGETTEMLGKALEHIADSHDEGFGIDGDGNIAVHYRSMIELLQEANEPDPTPQGEWSHRYPTEYEREYAGQNWFDSRWSCPVIIRHLDEDGEILDEPTELVIESRADDHGTRFYCGTELDGEARESFARDFGSLAEAQLWLEENYTKFTRKGTE